MKYYCNPVNVPYTYSFKKEPRDNFRLTVNREAADPSMVMYRGRYYLFASMSGTVWVSDDMAEWKAYRLPEHFPVYDYAPDVRVLGDWMYLTASNRGKNCDFYRTQDPIHGPYERVEGFMAYWDPNLFRDDDGRTYFYWGCDNRTPIRGIELDSETLRPIGQAVDLLRGDPWNRGYERFGEDHSESPRSKEEIDRCFAEFLEGLGEKAKDLPPENYEVIRSTFANLPYIEGAWMTKHGGTYYLQYACPGAEINVYADGVYVGESPLGPFRPAESNPFSYKPGGFLPGAGHGSTMEDRNGNWWHTATMRISKNHVFERRVGIWPAGFDADGNLFCNQRYGDWPVNVDAVAKDPWRDPEWFLLSFRAEMTASGSAVGHEPALAADENVQTWWKADHAAASHGEKPWLMMDLGEEMDIRAVQINFADDPENRIECPGEMVQTPDALRYLDLEAGRTRWVLEGAAGSFADLNWFVIEDKGSAETDLSHDLVVRETGIRVRYLRLTILEVPYHVAPSISGLRVFGIGDGALPSAPEASVVRTSDLDMVVSVAPAEDEDVVGYNILWGNRPDQLYHSRMVLGECHDLRIGALVKGQSYYVRVDAFNRNGIRHGNAMGTGFPAQLSRCKKSHN